MNSAPAINTKPKWSAFQITLLISGVYFVLGNLAGYMICSNTIPSIAEVLFYLFIPYTFTWLLSALAGADALSFIFIVGASLKTEQSRKANIERAIGFLSGKNRFVGRDKP